MDRFDIFARDHWTCVYCGEVFEAASLSLDHVQPRSRGGDNTPGNTVTACQACNTRKAGRRLAEFLLADPVALANFRRLAIHVWPRHLRTLEEALVAEQRRRSRQ
jgi:5-methylcytosine-specific restriction endonuclease McrA